MQIIDQIVEQNLGVYRASPTRLQEDIAQEAQVASDYRGRLAYELLQNADDAMEEEASQNDRVKFFLTDEALWVANNGRPLSDLDIQGLCGLGASSKVDSHGTRRASIGHKGLGFKSVLEITERPAAMSDGVAFELSEAIARRHVTPLFDALGNAVPSSLPVMRFPKSITEESPEWSSLRMQGFTTAFRFPFRADMSAEARSRLAESLLGLSLTTVLFLKHLDEVEVEVQMEGLDRKRSWHIEREELRDAAWHPVPGLASTGMYRIGVSSIAESATFLMAHDADVEIGNHRSGLSGPAWEGVTLSEVSLAVLEPTEALAEMPISWRRFHVFLPTAEPSPYPILVNGAFTTDLSRQSVGVNTDSRHDYNHFLIRRAASLFTKRILPILMDRGMEHVVSALERNSEQSGPAGAAFHSAMAEALGPVQLLPTTNGGRLSLEAAVFPPASLDDQAPEYRRLLVDNATWDGRQFPSSSVCTGRWSKVAADHGAIAIEVPDAVIALAKQLAPRAAVAVEHRTGGFEIDPVLEICSALYLSADRDERPLLQKNARSERLFPTSLRADRTFERVSLDGEAAFYPPRSAKDRLPLSGLQFMAHSLCWGALLPNERTELLGERLNTWTALFDVQEFRFEVVMREAVLPYLTIRGRSDAQRDAGVLADMDTLAAICQLAGRFPKPDRPLRYQRLGSDRALFNLSRLPVPCRGSEGQAIEWVPAYRAYFGRDWIKEASVENLAQVIAVADVTQELDVPYLLPPEHFLGRLDETTDRGQPSVEGQEGNEDEVDLDEDFDSTMESDEFAVWMAFLRWIGVNDALRPIHFHDVEDLESGWLTTKNLAQPKGWVFANAGAVWERYRSELVASDPRLSNPDVVPYFYELHDLEGLVAILGAAERDPSGRVGMALLEHLARHWEMLEDFTAVNLALVKKGLYPSQRAKPARPKAEELVNMGDNFWLHRLKTHSHFPTSHGPRRPDRSWMKSDDIDRRFGRRGQNAGEIVPIVQFGRGVPELQIRAVSSRLGVRSALTPATFTIEDARLLCRRLEHLYGSNPIEGAHLREVIRPAYRELFELLSGRSADPEQEGALSEEPLLVGLDGHQWFTPGNEVLYASTPGFLQRSGLADLVATFVLEAEPSANAPLSQLFGSRSLETAMDWRPDPGESAFTEEELAEFRNGLGELAPLILARVRVERRRPQDGRILREFVDLVEPVEELALTCLLDGESFSLGGSREYFVHRRNRHDPSQFFVLWGGQPWPPEPDEAQRLAMALADALEVNLVEAFLALVQSESAQQRRLLEIAGATSFLADARIELGTATSEPPGAGATPETPIATPTVSPTSEPSEEEPPQIDQNAKPAASPVELVSFDDLWIEGEPILIAGETGGQEHRKRDHGPKSQSGSHGMRAAPGTDLGSLDALGMRIAVAYEVNRLRKLGADDVLALAGEVANSAAVDLVIDVSTPRAIARARDQNRIADAALERLRTMGISQLHPGFDILTIIDGDVDRLIELKSSAVDARVQSMTWNEWKSARRSDIREQFWLYLVGNLRADLPSPPFLRAIRDPFGSLYSEEITDERVSRAVQLKVREFEQAEHLYLVNDAKSSFQR